MKAKWRGVECAVQLLLVRGRKIDFATLLRKAQKPVIINELYLSLNTFWHFP